MQHIGKTSALAYVIVNSVMGIGDFGQYSTANSRLQKVWIVQNILQHALAYTGAHVQ